MEIDSQMATAVNNEIMCDKNCGASSSNRKQRAVVGRDVNVDKLSTIYYFPYLP